MSDSARDLLTRGIAAAKAEERDEARFYLEWALRTDAGREQKAQAWLWLSEIATAPEEKRNCLEQALALDPSNGVARRGLAILDGRLDPAEIVDPDRLPASDQEGVPAPASTQRFVCPKCGGKMAFRPDGRVLACGYCGNEQTLFAAISQGSMVQEQDFTVAMATAKGHSKPVRVRTFSCQACGASFVLAPSVLSLTCSYCGSAHVVQLKATRRLILPTAIIPFNVSQKTARSAFRQWFDKNGLRGKVKVTPVRGLYVPAWTFDLSGEVRWQGFVDPEEDSSMELGGIQVSFGDSETSRRLVKEEGSHLLYEDDILVPASHKLPAELLMKEAEGFVLSEVVPYEEAYLADWPAEVYEISVSDASLVARRIAVSKAGHFINIRTNALHSDVRDLQLNTSAVVVESFKLILLPVWIGRYRYQEEIYYVLVNGQTGTVRAQEPQNWLQRFMDRLF
jgi:ribosomal protein S27AE